MIHKTVTTMKILVMVAAAQAHTAVVLMVALEGNTSIITVLEVIVTLKTWKETALRLIAPA